MNKGNIPIELTQDIQPNLSFPGVGRIVFAPNQDGRRVEWLPQQVADQLLKEPYNRPNRDPLFRIAQDLIANASETEFDARVKTSLGRLLGCAPDEVASVLLGVATEPKPKKTKPGITE